MSKPWAPWIEGTESVPSLFPTPRVPDQTVRRITVLTPQSLSDDAFGTETLHDRLDEPVRDGHALRDRADVPRDGLGSPLVGHDARLQADHAASLHGSRPAPPADGRRRGHSLRGRADDLAGSDVGGGASGSGGPAAALTSQVKMH